jgi:hypothetical protein
MKKVHIMRNPIARKRKIARAAYLLNNNSTICLLLPFLQRDEV